jgi:hypothetical protein
MMVARRPGREVGVPTLLRIGPYRFTIHSNDHAPPHVHVTSADGGAASPSPRSDTGTAGATLVGS